MDSYIGHSGIVADAKPNQNDDTNLYYRSSFNRDRIVHIVDADTATVETLSVLFRLDGFQTTFSTDAPHFISTMARRRADVAIINFKIGEEDGLGLLRRIKSTFSGTPVFMIADIPHIDAAVTAMKLGANDVLCKPFDNDYFLSVVRDALRSDIHLGAMSGGGRSVEIRGFGQLTPREREVLQLVTNGQSNKEVGRDMGISPRTVEVHRARVMEKLGARNTADLLRIVLTR
ncbi:MAG TPA: LuxR C-terminal-related transcriptional regulator [Devosia sp.]|nr:LuxR C-terminal-related transcriptional regulator [Devosia sp.]